MGNSLSTNSLTNNSQARLSSKFFYGCTTHEKLIEYIENFDYLLHFGYNKSANVLNVSEAIRGEIETLQVCIDICIGSNKMLAFKQARDVYALPFWTRKCLINYKKETLV